MKSENYSKRSSFLTFKRVGSSVHDSFGRDVLDLAVQNRFSVSKVSKLLGMTIYQLKSALEHAVGIGPKEYFRKYRAVLARQMMKDGRSLMDISEDLGFRYYTHFAAEIRAFYGSSPRDLQKAMLTVTGMAKIRRTTLQTHSNGTPDALKIGMVFALQQ